MEHHQHVAIYWDADNTSLAYIPKVQDFFAGRNQAPAICRAFGCCLSGKQIALLAATGFEPISVSPGSNAVDFTLTISAVTDRRQERRDTVAVVSSDCDYISLLRHLRNQGHHTIVFGRKDATDRLRNAADEFELLESALSTTPHPASVSIGVKDAIAEIISTHRCATPPTVAQVGNLLASRFPQLQRPYAGRLSKRLREIGFVLTEICPRGVLADYYVSLPQKCVSGVQIPCHIIHPIPAK